MALIVIPNIFSAGAVIIASQHNSNFSTIATDYNGNIDNNNIAPAAAIAYSKLNLAASIVNADINASAGIVGSKVDLTSPGAIGSNAPNTGAFTTLKIGTTHQGDILYDNGTSLIRLTPGTSGQFLQTQGNGANPQWAGSGMIFVSNTAIATAAASTDISITNTNVYKVIIVIPTSLNGNDTFAIRFNNNTGANYNYEFDGRTSGGAITGGAAAATSAIFNTSADLNYPIYIEFNIYPQDTVSSAMMISGNIVYRNSAGNLITRLNFGCYTGSITPATSFRILTNGGATWSGNVYLYRIALA